MLVDRAMPSVDYGKGCKFSVRITMYSFVMIDDSIVSSPLSLDRVGSEFWSQQVRIGNETTGVKYVCVCVCEREGGGGRLEHVRKN